MVKFGHIDALLDKEERDAMFNTQAVSILLDIARTCARQGISFRGRDNDENGNFQQLVKLMSQHCPVMKNWLENSKYRPYHATYLSPESQNEFIGLLGEDVRKKIIHEVQTAGFYSIMADTTPDVSHKDRLAVGV